MSLSGCIEMNDRELLITLRNHCGDVCVCIAGTEILVRIVKKDFMDILSHHLINEKRWQCYRHETFMQVEANN